MHLRKLKYRFWRMRSVVNDHYYHTATKFAVSIKKTSNDVIKYFEKAYEWQIKIVWSI